MPRSVDTSDRDAVVRQVRWCTAVQTSDIGELSLPTEKHPVGNIKPEKFIVQYPTKAAIKLPRAGDDARGSVQYTL